MELGRPRDELILSLEPQVALLVRRFFRQITSAVEREDMLSEAWIGAVLAVDAFDPGLGFTLRTFAERKIRGRILDYLRRMDPVTREERRKIRHGEAAAPVILPLLDHALPEHQAVDRLATVEAEVDARRLFARANLTARQRFVVERKYWEWSGDGEISVELGVHASRISQLHSRAIFQMRTVSTV